MKSLRSKGPWLAATIAAAAIMGCGDGSSELSVNQTPNVPSVPATASFRSAGFVHGTPVVTTDAAGNQTVSAAILTQSGLKTISTTPIAASRAAVVRASLTQGSLVDWIPGTDANTATVPTDAATTFSTILVKGTSTAAQFNLAKYGPSVTRNSNVPGPMVAAGWVYNKTASTVTVGDGGLVKADMASRAYATPIKRYEETYQVSPNAVVYNVNTADYSKSTVSSLASMPVTANYDYATTARQAAYLLFDASYLFASEAKVVAIWYFTPQSTSDGKPVWEVPTQSPMLADKGVDQVSGQPYISINATGVTAAPYTRSTEPFEMVKNTMYYVGDNEVSSYILKADMGTADPSDDKVIKIDAGWANSGYQYWKNMELVGVDPRSVTDLWLTHGHGDHYGTVVEQLKMMDNAGKPITLWGSKEDSAGILSDLQGNTWNVPGALPASETVIRARTTKNYDYDKWYDFGNVQIFVIWSPGHTPGTTNMLFKVKNPDDGKFYTFGYHGGYGFNGMERPTTANGFLRLAWQAGFSYLQQKVEVDFVSPQHGNQFPIVEVFQGLKAYNRDPANASRQLSMLDAMRTKVADSAMVAGVNVMSEFDNQLEKRRSVVSYKVTDAQGANRSIETSGPFKPGRESGLVGVKAIALDGGRIVQGFNSAQNKNARIPLLANGIASATDTYVNDPGGFYVQVAIDVQDAVYKGYLPEGFTQFSPGMNATITYRGGPIDSVHSEKGSFHPPEYLRTQRLGSLADAQKVLATITKGKTHTISLTNASEIVVPADVAKAFQ